MLRRASSGGDRWMSTHFPTISIERIDVLKEGASAIYGSDAVAGVVNYVTRSDFEGF